MRMILVRSLLLTVMMLTLVAKSSAGIIFSRAQNRPGKVLTPTRAVFFPAVHASATSEVRANCQLFQDRGARTADTSTASVPRPPAPI